ncbi:MAG: SWIM zinc finger family protein [Planctomycetota bacterium]|nr:SWIM zinc finger family protein [Planctomycetota bacterium]
MRFYYGYQPYVPVAQRQAEAAMAMAKLARAGKKISPVVIQGRNIATTFWGIAWCENLESYSDFANRLPRGRTYARNGSVVHLEIGKGQIASMVRGSSLYHIQIEIDELPKVRWQALKKECGGQVGSLVELLQGRLSKAVMGLVTDRDKGLFPKPKEIRITCSCPDDATLCKHIAATMYGVGNRLDKEPGLLFLLRGVDQSELIEEAVAPGGSAGKSATVLKGDLAAIFDIELGDGTPVIPGKGGKSFKVPAEKKTAGKSGKPATRMAKTAKPLAGMAPKPAARMAKIAKPIAGKAPKPAARMAKIAKPIAGELRKQPNPFLARHLSQPQKTEKYRPPRQKNKDGDRAGHPTAVTNPFLWEGIILSMAVPGNRDQSNRWPEFALARKTKPISQGEKGSGGFARTAGG